MRKTILLVAIAFASVIAHAQVLKIVSMQQIATPDNMEGKVVGISPKGDYLLLTDLSNTGLVRYELASKTATTITDAEGAGWDVKISQDGNKITYRQRHDNNQLIRHDIMQYNVADGKAIVRQQAQRGTAQLVAADANTTVSVNEDLHLVLTQNGKTLSVAESCTGGRVASEITAIPGASAFFNGSVTSYSNTIKEKVLGVDPQIIIKHGAVSKECAEAMAAGVLERLETDFSVATTGIAGPGGGTPEKPVGTVWIATAYRDKKTSEIHTSSQMLKFSSNRATNIDRFCGNALNMLRKMLFEQLHS